MNRGHIQAERAASAQRDLFDTVAHYYKLRSSANKEADRLRKLGYRVDPLEVVQYEQRIDSEGRVYTRHPGFIVRAERARTGPTVRSLTNTFNNKL